MFVWFFLYKKVQRHWFSGAYVDIEKKDSAAAAAFSQLQIPKGKKCLVFTSVTNSAGLQNGMTFFFIGCMLSLEKYMLDKSFHFICFPIFFWSLSVSFLFFEKNRYFLPKIVYIGGEQIN